MLLETSDAISLKSNCWIYIIDELNYYQEFIHWQIFAEVPSNSNASKS